MFWDNFVHYCTKAGTSPNAVAKELGLSSGSVTAWKNGTTPRSSAVIKIANYFQIEIEDLINGKDNTKEKRSYPIDVLINGFRERLFLGRY